MTTAATVKNYEQSCDPATITEQNCSPTTNYEHFIDDDDDEEEDYEREDYHPYDSQLARNTSESTKRKSSNFILSFFETQPVNPNSPIVLRQRRGYVAILFSLAQTIMLVSMLATCGFAPIDVNPMLGPDPDTLSTWGGTNPRLIIKYNEWWRHLTPVLLNVGILHLFCNVTLLLKMGILFEREWGSMNWLIIYLSSAVGSSIMSCIFNPDSVSVDSSGAIMGIFGAKLAEILFRCRESEETLRGAMGHIARAKQLRWVIFSSILVCAFSFAPYVNWAVHLAGLGAGFLTGIPIASWHIDKIFYRILLLLTGWLFIISCFIFGFLYLYSGIVVPSAKLDDVCGYYEEIYRGNGYQCNSCQVFQ